MNLLIFLEQLHSNLIPIIIIVKFNPKVVITQTDIRLSNNSRAIIIIAFQLRDLSQINIGIEFRPQQCILSLAINHLNHKILILCGYILENLIEGWVHWGDGVVEGKVTEGVAGVLDHDVILLGD